MVELTLRRRKSSLTAESLADYKNLIETAHEDLQAHLKNVDEKLNDVITQRVSESAPQDPDLRAIKEERLSAIRCLEICAQLSQHVDQMQLISDHDEDEMDDLGQDTISQRITREGLDACKDSLSHTAARLEGYMKDITNRIIQKSKAGLVSDDDIADLERLRDEWNATRESVKLCAVAGNHLRNNVSSIENHGVGDSVQFMVSTNGQVIHGKNRGMGWKNRQVGGHMSDNVVLQLSQDMVKEDPQVRNPDGLTFRAGMPSESEPLLDVRQDAPFGGRHGKGFKLETQPLSNTVSYAADSGSVRNRLAKS